MSKQTNSPVEFSRLGVCLILGAATWVIPGPDGMSDSGWHTFGIFATTILSFLIRPLAMGPMVLLGLIALSATGTIAYKTLIQGFGDTVAWLVVAAFLIAGAVQRTGFGRRIALTLVALMGRSTLGIGYAICGAELILGPVVPSNTARGGGVLAPIVQSLSVALGSHPTESPDRAGRYLVLTGAHANLVTAAMFMTGMAANPLISKAASATFGIDFGWGTWALGAIVPGLVALALIPLLMYRLVKPTISDARSAQEKARSDLAEMGTWTRGQKTMAVLFVVLILLWSTKSVHGMGSGLVAWIGVAILLLTGTESWDDVTGNAKAWDTLIWLGGLLAMATALKDEGVVAWFANSVQGHVTGLGPMALVLSLALIYFFSMYGFSMLSAHISALAGAFFAVAAAVGSPPMLIVPLIAYFSSVCGCTTNYSTGPVIIYFGLGYVPTPTWFKVGAVMALFHITVWIGVGLVWWKILGWW